MGTKAYDRWKRLGRLQIIGRNNEGGQRARISSAANELGELTLSWCPYKWSDDNINIHETTHLTCSSAPK